jgi:hypothetical protein
MVKTVTSSFVFSKGHAYDENELLHVHKCNLSRFVIQFYVADTYRTLAMTSIREGR